MRTLLVATVLFTAILAGCSSKGGGHDDTFTCPDGKTILNLEDYPDHDNATFNATSKCPPVSGGKGNSTSNSTSRAPNVPPTLVLTSKDAAGNVTNTTMLMGNLTFSGAGSADSDGSITGMAMSITDSNGTRTVTLYDPVTKTFPDALVVFDKAGRVNVSVAVVDDRGAFATLETKVFVDELATYSKSFPAFAPASSTTGTQFRPCDGTGNAIADAEYFLLVGINVPDEASWIEATSTSSNGFIAICGPDPDGTGPAAGPILSNRHASKVVTLDGTPLPAANGVSTYQLGIYKTTPAPGNVVGTTTVHYGPKPAPPA